jgi:hypothetical protein
MSAAVVGMNGSKVAADGVIPVTFNTEECAVESGTTHQGGGQGMNRKTLNEKIYGMGVLIFFWFVPAMFIGTLFLDDFFGYGKHWYGLWVFTAIYAWIGCVIIKKWFVYKTMEPEVEN